jgi:hypothetical protein
MQSYWPHLEQDGLPEGIFYHRARWVYKNESAMEETFLAAHEQLREKQAIETMTKIAKDANMQQAPDLRFGANTIHHTLRWNDLQAKIAVAKKGAEARAKDH